MLLGKHVTITDADNLALVGLQGEVIEDRKDTIRIRTAQGEKLLVKHTITFEVDGKTIEGKTLVGIHSTRMKK